MTTKRNKAEQPLSELHDWQGATMDDVSKASQAYMNGVAAVNQEIANFLQTRLRHDIELGESLARCRTLTEATRAQGDWLKQATDDYTAETQKLFELGSTLMSGAWTPMDKSKAAPESDGPGAMESQSK
jgi:hypothetical protein